MFHRIASAVRTCNDEQFEAISDAAKKLDPSLVRVLKALRKDGASSLEKAIPEALDLYWEERLNAETAATFRALMQR
jgi:hypothetical protein